jgi:glucosamine-phosphate N-acetyltransferase
MSSNSLFSSDLISSEVATALPEGYTIRPLQKSDYHAGFLDVLAVLTTVGDVSEQDFVQRFEEMQTSGKGAGGYHILVILDGEKKIVGTGALIVERKL